MFYAQTLTLVHTTILKEQLQLLVDLIGSSSKQNGKDKVIFKNDENYTQIRAEWYFQSTQKSIMMALRT